jgi:hypothetical protein
MKLSSILDQIDLKNYALPVFQRGYVWNREQVRKLMNSLYKGYPIGSLLIWVTQTNVEEIKEPESGYPGIVHLILDGQQRITTLYGIIRGEAPPFFDGSERAFTGLYFNVKEEIFEFFQAAKMTNNPDWINVTEVMSKGAGEFVQHNIHHIHNIDKLNNISNVRNVDLPIQEVSGEDKTIDVVVDIFNNVNSGGTKLSKGDLALAKLCAQWPGARDELNNILDWLSSHSFSFSMDWLLRCVTVFLTGQPYFTGLSSVSVPQFRDSLPKVKALIGTILDQIGSRLGLDHDRVLSGVFAIPVIIHLVKSTKEANRTNQFWNKILYWYIHTFIWGRYSGSTESVLAKDLNSISSDPDIENLISLLRKDRGDLTIRPEDFVSWSTGSRFYPLLYMMTRVGHSIDWLTGVELSNNLLGKHSKLEIHHIFPKAQLYAKEYEKAEVNALANYTFLTKETNLAISNKKPEDYFLDVLVSQPTALATHWIPEDPKLRDLKNYKQFLHERRILLADAANKILNNLYQSTGAGAMKQIASAEPQLEIADFGTYSHDDDDIILEVASWVEGLGFDPGQIYYEVVDESSSSQTIFDLAWPDGIQPGLSEPLALIIESDEETYSKASSAGYKFFTSVEDLKKYITINYVQNGD